MTNKALSKGQTLIVAKIYRLLFEAENYPDGWITCSQCKGEGCSECDEGLVNFNKNEYIVKRLNKLINKEVNNILDTICEGEVK